MCITVAGTKLLLYDVAKLYACTYTHMHACMNELAHLKRTCMNELTHLKRFIKEVDCSLHQPFHHGNGVTKDIQAKYKSVQLKQGLQGMKEGHIED